MTENLFRSFAPDLEVRSGGGGRTVYGIAVPYHAPTRIDDRLVEQFARGAFNHQLDRPQRVKFAREHAMLGGTLIGAASLLRDDAAGLYVELQTSKTPAGDETLELVRDHALDQLSIMFRTAKDRKLGDGTVERVTADLREVAIVMEGAYGDQASVVGVRSRATQEVFDEAEADLRRRAEHFLMPGAIRDLPDTDLLIRTIKLGMPFNGRRK
jgi:HK97 family phage prohead protease